MIGVLVLPRDEDRDETIIVGHVIEQIRSRDSEEPTGQFEDAGRILESSRLEVN